MVVSEGVVNDLLSLTHMIGELAIISNKETQGQTQTRFQARGEPRPLCTNFNSLYHEIFLCRTIRDMGIVKSLPTNYNFIWQAMLTRSPYYPNFCEPCSILIKFCSTYATYGTPLLPPKKVRVMMNSKLVHIGWMWWDWKLFFVILRQMSNV